MTRLQDEEAVIKAITDLGNGQLRGPTTAELLTYVGWGYKETARMNNTLRRLGAHGDVVCDQKKYWRITKEAP